MKVRRYYARNLHEGMQLIKKELGNDAIIIESRSVRQKGLRGFFKPRIMEIVAAVDNQNRNAGKRWDAASGNGIGEGLAEEVGELKSMMQRFMNNNGNMSSEQETESLEHWRKHLESHDVTPQLIQNIIEYIRCNLSGEVKLTDQALSMIIEKKLDQYMKYAAEKTSRVQVLLGPTGVGKTTTLAKLAARYSFYHQEKVGLITVDHFRIGAVEQLRTYSEIVDVPLEVVMSPSDLPGALKRLENCERILVDTAGRGTGNQMQIKELSGYLRELKEAEKFLVISATTRWQDVEHVAQSFSELEYNRLIITKVDETFALGAPLNAVYFAKAPLVYVTNGQNVPEDIKTANEMEIPTLVAGVKE